MKKKIYYKSANKYITVHYLQRAETKTQEEQYNKKKVRKEREWQPLLNSINYDQAVQFIVYNEPAKLSVHPPPPPEVSRVGSFLSYKCLVFPKTCPRMKASKAFDKISHWTLFRKLIDRNVPMYLIKVLCYWYQHKLISVRWGYSISNVFNVTNGVRQSGILSPKLVNIYIDGLSNILNNSLIGGSLGGKRINHICYMLMTYASLAYPFFDS